MSSTFEHPELECSCNISRCGPTLHQTIREKNANICFYLTFNWLGLIGICSRAQKCAKGSSDSIETAFDLVLHTRVGPPAKRRFTITNNAFAYGTSEQRQGIEKGITADTSCKLTGGEQYRGATTRAIPSRCRDGPRIGGAVMMAASEVSSDYPLSYIADAKWYDHFKL